MNRKSLLSTALTAALLPAVAFAQASTAPAQPSAPAAAAPATAAPVTPKAIPAKIALIAFEQAVVSTNEGQRTVDEVNKKYEPKKKQLDDLNSEIDSLKKQLSAAPASMSQDEKASRAKTIDTKEKQLNRDLEDTQQAYQSDQQEALSKVAQKVNVVLQNYVKQNGFTLLLDVSNQGSNVMWADQQTDITEAVVQAYNSSSGVTAPPPAAPSAARPRSSAPGGSTTPRSTAPSTAKPPQK
jgi:Skp family chaperone for outer membrane proteins